MFEEAEQVKFAREILLTMLRSRAGKGITSHLLQLRFFQRNVSKLGASEFNAGFAFAKERGWVVLPIQGSDQVVLTAEGVAEIERLREKKEAATH